MEKKKSVRKKALCLSLTAALAVTAFAGMGAVVSATNNSSQEKYGLVENIQDGTILHCFDWKYTDIQAELENIAKAGFTSIQTSPAQPSEGTGAWYWLYQPVSFTAGENDLGTPDQLKALCEAADEYGIKVIVDVVANHLAGNHDNIQSDLQADEYWHNEGAVTSYSNRHQVTHGDIGMADINSENEYVQQVVAGYVNDLKELGVDGIRWDAAKHIALPSEDCGFWPAVTNSGLYNYGEILKGPTDNGGNDLMKEYTDFMSVTDSSYCDSMLSSFARGKAPDKTGNWSEKGVASDKLVYWGESHDTYSNKEGAGSNNVEQNIVDRAYAVAAARSDASALYLSRPFAKARDSIRIGVKGSMHFTSPEIAAVNHFHNAMVGKADNYTVSDNCAVITRQNGGAVIVCGEGSGEVSVENGGKYAVPGTYKDEVTGNTFVVTETTITGKVGESGIAVIYDSDFVSKVYAEPDTDTDFTDSIDVTLHAVDVTDTSYTVELLGENGALLDGTFSDGDVITIGSQADPDTTVTLTLYGTNADGDKISSTYKYNKKLSREYPQLNGGGVVLDNTKTGWTTVNVYVYDESGAETITNGSWPGVKMQDCGNNYYSYELPEQFASCNHIMVIFNNGSGDQIPGAMQDGLTMAYSDKKLYDGTTWLDLPGSTEPEPVVDTDTSDDTSKDTSKDTSDDTSKDTSNDTSDDTSKDTSNDTSDNTSKDTAKDTSTDTGNDDSSDKQDSQTIVMPDASQTNNNGSGTSQQSNQVNTSDSTPVAAFIIAAAAAASVAFILGRKKRED